jgi:hypothetical protein
VKTNDSVIVPAGAYWLGDPCYSVPDEMWMPWLEAADFKGQDGVLWARVPGTDHRVLGFSTAYGDGTYIGSNGFEYGVDAGLIGLVPQALAPLPKYPELVSAIVFVEDTRCTTEDGVLIFGHVSINTADEGYDDDEDYDGQWYGIDQDEEDDQ